MLGPDNAAVTREDTIPSAGDLHSLVGRQLTSTLVITAGKIPFYIIVAEKFHELGAICILISFLSINGKNLQIDELLQNHISSK